MGILTDATAIQFRLLNRGKGPAMHSPRAQCDKKAYQFLAKRTVEGQPGLTLRQEMVDSTTGIEDGRVVGVLCRGDARYHAKAVVLTTGTFLQALMHTGEVKTPGGRGGEGAAVGLSASLRSLGFELLRFKTGTPPRLNGRTIDFDRLEPQPGDDRSGRLLVPDRCRDSAPARLPHHLHELRRARLDPSESPSRADVFGPDREHGPALLSLDRRQDRSVCRPRRLIRSSWSPREETRSNTTATESRRACRATFRSRSFR